MSYKPEVLVSGDDGKWNSNALRFATHDEAHKYVRDLMSRWTLVMDTRVVESDEPVNADINENNELTIWKA